MNHKRISVRIAAADWASLRHLLFTEDGNENAAALLCGSADSESELRLLVKRILPVRMEAYNDRTSFHLEVEPTFYNEVITNALCDNLNPIIIHSHPHSGQARYSTSDDYGESRLLPVLQALVPGKTIASLLVTQISAAGRMLVKGQFRTLHSLVVVGQRTETIFLSASENVPSAPEKLFDRQVRAFGVEGQIALSRLKIAIVGVGGTGSVVAEELARVGVKDVLLLDSDSIEDSNVSRLFGSYPDDVGTKKVKVIAAHLRKLGAKNVHQIADTALRQPVLMHLRDRDIVFSCVDNDRSRSILNRFAHQYLIPVVDVGVRLDGRTGAIQRVAGRVSLVGSGMICLRCSQHVSAERIRAESLPISERRNLQREGYVMGIDEPVPAVVSLNVTLAGLAVTAALNMFLNLTGGVQPLNQLYDATDGIVFTAKDNHESECDVCGESTGVKALGDLQIVSAYD